MAKSARASSAADATGGGTSSAVLPNPDEVVKPFPIEAPEVKRPGPKIAKPEPEDDESEGEKPSVDETSDEEAGGAEDNTENLEESEEVIDASLMRQAEELGFDDEQIQTAGSNAQLRILCAIADKQRADMTKAQRMAGQQPSRQPVQQQQQTVTPQQQMQVATEQLAKLELKLSKDYSDPDVVEAITQLKDYMEKLDAKISGKVQPIEEYLRAQAHDSRVQAFDRAIASLPKEFEKLIGKGESLEMDQGSEFFKRRDEIFDTADNIVYGYVSKGQKPPPLKKVVERAAYAVCASKLKSIARSEIEEKIETRTRQLDNAPTHRSAPAPKQMTVDEELAQVIKTFKRKHRV